MVDIIKPFPGEDSEAYIRRRAYFNRLLRYRFHVGDERLKIMLKKAVPINADEKRKIDEIWAPYLPLELRDLIVDYRYYDCYKVLKSEEDDLFKYIPDSFFKTFIDDYYTNPQHSAPCDDKNYYDLFFYDIDRPKTLFRKIKDLFLDANFNEITLKDVIRIAKEHQEVICKIAKFSGGGNGVIIWSSEQDEETKLIEFLQSYDFIVCQEMIEQHDELSRLNPSSVNTLRMFTLVFQGEAHLLSSVLRIGINDSRFDNASLGGLACGIKPNGQLKDVGWNIIGEKFTEHPRGIAFNSVTIPYYHECINLVKSLAKRMSSTSRLISWDLAISKTGHPMLIECNFTITGTESLQIPNGPLLGDLTYDVLKDVFANSFTLKSIIKSFQ